MKQLSIFLSAVLLLLSGAANAEAITEIHFAKGAVSSVWKGVIKDGNKKFKLSLGQGQALKVGGDDVYTWSVTAPNGEVLGCDGNDYCVPDGVISALPVAGVYIVSTDYRMSGCANCASAKTRKVAVSFEAK